MKIEIVWNTDDVFDQAKRDGVDISEEQASLVLQRMKRYHDACVGINWDVISYHIEEVLREAKK